MVIFTVRIHLAAECRATVLQSLREKIWQIQAMPGCLYATVLVDASDESEIVLSEEWRTEELLAARLRDQSLRVVLAAIDSSIVEPHVYFDTVSERRGLEYISACREAMPAD